jgi:hypothetical protein
MYAYESIKNKLHIVETIIIKVIKSSRVRWERHAARMGQARNAHNILVAYPEGNIPLGRPRH